MRLIGKALSFAAALLFSAATAICGDDATDSQLIFHFNFKDAAGKATITDRTGKAQCLSKNRDFVIQKEALRLAPCAEIYIPSENLPAVKDELTLSAWILKKSTPDYTPILSKGAHPGPLQFLLTLSWRYPGFCYKLPNLYHKWQGISIDGMGGSSSKYSDEKWMVPGAKFIESSGYWRNVTAVFNKGKVELYIDGALVAKREVEKPESLQPDNSPIWVGVEKVVNEKENYMTADMLLNDLRMYGKALSSDEVKALYEQDSPKYPRGSQIPPGETHINAIPVCLDYMKAVMKGYDPTFDEKLDIAKKYEQNVPSDPYVGRNIEATIENHKGRNYFSIDGDIRYPVMYLPAVYDFTNNKYTFREMGLSTRDFAAAGIDLVSFGVFPDLYCLDEGKYDWDKIDDVFRKIIQANPKASIIAYYMLISPPWFEKKYPDDVEQCYFGQSLRPMTRCGQLGSERWLEASKRMLKDFVSHVEASDYAGHVFGYLSGGGQSAEWYWPGSVYGGFTGYSKATCESFRKWLARKYGNDNARLREAWQDPKAAFATVEVPSPDARMVNDAGLLFLDPKKHRRIYDLREYKSDTTFLHIEESAKTIKEACGGKKLIAVYSGYSTPMVSHKLYNAGLQNIHRIFSSPFIDVVITPIDYGKRRGGEAGFNVNPFNGTAALQKKILWEENDLRTHFHTKMESGRTASLEETLTVIKRGFGYSITRNTGFWWLLFDNAWFHQEDIMRTVAAIKKAADKSIAANQSSVSEVAFVFDEKAPFHLAYAPQSDFLRGQAWNACQEAVRMGAPFDMYLMEDLLNKKMPDYKLYVFLNAYRADESTMNAIEAKVRKNNAVSVWCYAPGYATQDGVGVAGMEQLTGMKFEVSNEEKTLTLQIVDKNAPITRYASACGPYKFGPVFHCADSGAKILGVADGKTALAVKEFAGWRSVYSEMPLTKELLMGLCDYAGAHVYSRSFDILTANKSHMMLHTSTAGGKEIKLKDPARVSEILTGDVIGTATDNIVETLPAQATRIYELKPIPGFWDSISPF